MRQVRWDRSPDVWVGCELGLIPEGVFLNRAHEI